ncbi:MAG: FecR domain-containing protein [Bacteroidales bacterium]
MKQTEYKKTEIGNHTVTNRAWERLHKRLELEGLIPEPQCGRTSLSGNGHTSLSGNRYTSPIGNEFISTLSGHGYCAPGFISGQKRNRSVPWGRLAQIGGVAAVLIACTYFLSVRFSNEFSDVKVPLLAKENTGEFTLVTTLEEGSVVYLSQMATLYYPEHFLQQKREVKLNGTALFEVEGNRERPFVIETDKVLIEVLGTAFNVKNDLGKPFELSVCRGSVKVSLKEGKGSVNVAAGKTVTLTNGYLRISDTEDTGQFDLYSTKMRFKDESLKNVLRVMNMHIPAMQIQTSPLLGERKLTVAFLNDSAESMAELISLALNLKIKRVGDKIILSE